MNTITSRQIVKMLSTCVAISALAVTTSVSAAGTQTLNDANTDFDSTSSVSKVESTYDSDVNTTSFVLENDYDEYAPRNSETLEKAEFAAFEIPESLEVRD